MMHTRSTATILRGNALELPLADNSVDLVITSPPYFALRSYQDAGEHYSGQIGSEATPAEFVDALIAATREMVRVVKPSGSIWVNLGDKYAGSGMGGNTSLANSADYLESRAQTYEPGRRKSVDIRSKSLMGMPWRYALRCIDDLGLILRAEVIWSKPNGLPESVTDRVRRSHETWFHFTLEPRYYSAVDEIREPHAQRTIDQAAIDARSTARRHVKLDASRESGGLRQNYTPPPNPLGKLPGSVWSIPTQPLRVPAELGIDHFAAFPMEFPRRIIQGWSPAGVCTACGEGRRPVADHEQVDAPGGSRAVLGRAQADAVRTTHIRKMGRGATVATITGYACACPEPTARTTPARVLDPFGGTGTTALVAKALGRQGISIDMSADYCRLAQWRTTDEGELAGALQVDKPARQVDGQASLFDLTEGAGA